VIGVETLRTGAEPLTHEDASAFVLREAELADARDYDAWLNLWCCDSLYWAPYHRGTDPHREVSMIYDDAERLKERVDRLKSGAAWAQVPPTTTLRVVSNISVRHVADGRDLVSAKFILLESANAGLIPWGGHVEYTLCRRHEGLHMTGKTVHLVNATAALPNLTFLI
jgi:3-phenylpropionate/cinnamic acid dioxygenase small subunit